MTERHIEAPQEPTAPYAFDLTAADPLHDAVATTTRTFMGVFARHLDQADAPSTARALAQTLTDTCLESLHTQLDAFMVADAADQACAHLRRRLDDAVELAIVTRWPADADRPRSLAPTAVTTGFITSQPLPALSEMALQVLSPPQGGQLN